MSDTQGRGPLHMAAHCKGSKAKNILDILLQKGSCDVGKIHNIYNSVAFSHENMIKHSFITSKMFYWFNFRCTRQLK